MAVNIPQYYARVVGGLKEGHLRLMYYGLCKGHETRAQKTPISGATALGLVLDDP